MEIQDLIARIEKLEAETNVLRRYLRAAISLLPNTQPINAVFNEVHRQVNLDSLATHGSVENHLQKANSAMGISQVPRLGYLKS
jgi:predicted regulator of amino acid metabolism with ACT domain